MKKTICCVLCVIIFSVRTISVFACSIFMYQNDSAVYFCGNEDWSATDPAIFTVPAKEEKYGVILLGWNSYLPNYAQAGINSAGLCFDWASVPQQNFVAEQNKPSLSVNSTLDILQFCSTVQEVIEYTSKYNFPHLAEEHIMFADATGDACVLEFTKGKTRIVRKTEHFLAITNFNLTNPQAGWYPCNRYKIMTFLLQKRFTCSAENPLQTQLTSVLKAIHQDGQYPTIYSYVIDLKTMELIIFYNHNFEKPSTFSVSELLTKKQKILIR